jgi:hypothetical protein
MIMEDMLARGETYIGAHVKDRPTFIPPRLTITQVRIHDSSAGDAPKQPAQ